MRKTFYNVSWIILIGSFLIWASGCGTGLIGKNFSSGDSDGVVQTTGGTDSGTDSGIEAVADTSNTTLTIPIDASMLPSISASSSVSKSISHFKADPTDPVDNSCDVYDISTGSQLNAKSGPISGDSALVDIDSTKLSSGDTLIMADCRMDNSSVQVLLDKEVSAEAMAVPAHLDGIANTPVTSTVSIGPAAILGFSQMAVSLDKGDVLGQTTHILPAEFLSYNPRVIIEDIQNMQASDASGALGQSYTMWSNAIVAAKASGSVTNIGSFMRDINGGNTAVMAQVSGIREEDATRYASFVSQDAHVSVGVLGDSTLRDSYKNDAAFQKQFLDSRAATATAGIDQMGAMATAMRTNSTAMFDMYKDSSFTSMPPSAVTQVVSQAVNMGMISSISTNTDQFRAVYTGVAAAAENNTFSGQTADQIKQTVQFAAGYVQTNQATANNTAGLIEMSAIIQVAATQVASGTLNSAEVNSTTYTTLRTTVQLQVLTPMSGTVQMDTQTAGSTWNTISQVTRTAGTQLNNFMSVMTTAGGLANLSGGGELTFQFNPMDQETLVSSGIRPQVTISGSLDNTSVTRENATLVCDGVTRSLLSNGGFLFSSGVVKLVPAAPLPKDKTCVFRLSNIKSLSGKSYSPSVSFGIERDIFDCTIASPADGAPRAATNSVVTGSCTYPIDSNTATSSNIFVNCGASNLAGSVTLSSDRKSFSYRASSSYPTSTYCTANVSTYLKEADAPARNFGRNIQNRFTTGLGEDVTSPVWPSNVTMSAQELGATSIRIGWSLRPTDDVTPSFGMAYKTWCAETSGGENVGASPNAVVNPTPPTSISNVTVSSLSPNRTYYCIVRAFDETGNASASSSEVSARTRLDTPSNFVATVVSDNNVINLSWDSVTAATGYRIFWSTSPGVSSGSTSVDVNTTGFGHTNLSWNAPYYYKVAAFDGSGGLSSLSAERSASTIALNPFACTLSPANGASNQPTNTQIIVSCNYPMDPATATSSNIFANFGSGNLAGTVTLSEDRRTATYSPTLNYSTQSSGTANLLTGLSDRYGRFLALAIQHTFGTGRGTDVIVPTGFDGARSGSPNGTTAISVAWYGYTPAQDNVTLQHNIVYKAFCSAISGGQNFSGSTCGTAGPNSWCASQWWIDHPQDYLNMCLPHSVYISGLTPGTTYYVVVRAYDEAGNFETNTSEVSAITYSPPAAPTNVTASSGNNTSHVCWTQPAGTSVDYYNIYYNTWGSPSSSNYSGSYYISGSSSCYDISLSNGTTYYLALHAFNYSAGMSDVSNQVQVTPALPAPTGLTATVVGTSQVNLSWTAGSAIGYWDSYYIERKTGSGSFSQITSQYNFNGTTTYSNTGLTGATSYTYRVRAYSGGYSGYSNEAGATTATPSGILDTTYGTGGVLTPAASLLNNSNIPSFTYTGGNLFLALDSSSGGNNMGIAKVTSAGALDATFGTSGVMNYDAAGSNGYDASGSIAVDSAGKVYVGGTYGSIAAWTKPFLCRFTSAGAIDTTFQTNGCKKDFSSSSQYFDSIYAIAQHPTNGNIYAVGQTYPTSSSQSVMKLWAFNSSGTYLGNYATWTSNTGNTLNNPSPSAIAFDASGNLLITGSVNSTSLGRNVAAVWRYSSAGTADATFGTSGLATISTGSYAAQAAVDSSGRIVVVGRAPTNGGDAMVARLTSAGALDNTFATSGVWTYNITGTNEDSAKSLVIDNTNQAIYVTGQTYRSGLTNGSYFYTGTDLLLVKFDFNGAPVSLFGTSGNGIVVYNSGNIYNGAADLGAGLYLDGSGKVFIVGENNGSVATMRYLP